MRSDCAVYPIPFLSNVVISVVIPNCGSRENRSTRKKERKGREARARAYSSNKPALSSFFFFFSIINKGVLERGGAKIKNVDDHARS
jgi:hypothetical protein